MKLKNLLLAMGMGLCLVTAAQQAGAVGISPMIGDNDGFGFGALAVPDNAVLLNINLPEDRRSAAEAAASNGAQQTDFYSAVFTPLPSTFDVIFPLLGGVITNNGTARFIVDMGGFQATTLGQISVLYNGIAQSGLLNFEDGALASRVRSFVIGAAAVDAANLAGEFRVTFDRSASNDAIAFDYFQLRADVTPIPEPEIYAMLAAGLGLMGFVARRRKQQLAAA